jgi:hypothetical protein
MEKYSEQRISSDARGLLRFLTEIPRDNYHEVDLILTGDVDIHKYTFSQHFGRYFEAHAR